MSCDNDEELRTEMAHEERQSIGDTFTQSIRDDCWTDAQRYSNWRMYWHLTNSSGSDWEHDEVFRSTFLDLNFWFNEPPSSLAYSECPDEYEDDPGNCGSADCQDTFPAKYEFAIEHSQNHEYTAADYEFHSPRPDGEDGFDHADGIQALSLIMSAVHPPSGRFLSVFGYYADNLWFSPFTVYDSDDPQPGEQQRYYWEVDPSNDWPDDPCRVADVQIQMENNRADGEELPVGTWVRAGAAVPAYTRTGSSDLEDGVCPCEDDVILIRRQFDWQYNLVTLTSRA